MKTLAEINQLAKAISPTIEAALNKCSDEILITKQVADMLGVKVNAIYNRCSKGEIPYKKKGGRKFFSKNEILKCFLGK
jgi:hypothetical protein